MPEEITKKLKKCYDIPYMPKYTRVRYILIDSKRAGRIHQKVEYFYDDKDIIVLKEQ